jgi:two-component sensor histidine kinase
VTSVFLNPAHIIALDAACIGSASYYFLNSDDIRLHEYLAYWILGVISLSLLVYFCGRLVRKLTYSLGEKLDENALLLKEIHHRIKNNLQLVSSVINIRPDNSADPAFAEYKNEITARMSAVGNLHELLYKAETASSIDLSNYLKSVWRAFEETTGALPNVNFEFSEVRCGWSSAVALGMILSELTANVAKHSGLNREEAVTCRLERNGNKISLSVANPGEFSLAEEKQKFGRQIIEALAKKRNGSFTLRTDDWGVTATVVVEDQKS